MIIVTEIEDRGRNGRACKMASTNNPDELRAFVCKLGLKPAWIKSDTILPHINLFPSQRIEAIKAGAEPVSREQYLKLLSRACSPETLQKAG